MLFAIKLISNLNLLIITLNGFISKKFLISICWFKTPTSMSKYEKNI